jgi:hypothetical protein
MTAIEDVGGAAAFSGVGLGGTGLSRSNLTAEATTMKSGEDVEKRQAWEARLERFRTSGQTVVRFCAQERVSANTFYYWARRVRSASTSIGNSRAKRAGRSQGSRQALPQQSAYGTRTDAGLVRFHLSAAVQVSVPADCLDAIRCLAESLQQAQRERSDAFQEILVKA